MFRDFIDATATVMLNDNDEEMVVRFQRRAHNPLLVRADFARTDVRIPWLGGKRLQLIHDILLGPDGSVGIQVRKNLAQCK